MTLHKPEAFRQVVGLFLGSRRALGQRWQYDFRQLAVDQRIHLSALSERQLFPFGGKAGRDYRVNGSGKSGCPLAHPPGLIQAGLVDPSSTHLDPVGLPATVTAASEVSVPVVGAMTRVVGITLDLGN